MRIHRLSPISTLYGYTSNHPGGYIASLPDLKGPVVGEGNTYEEALADAKSAIPFQIETFGQDVLEANSPVLETFVAEAVMAT